MHCQNSNFPVKHQVLILMDVYFVIGGCLPITIFPQPSQYTVISLKKEDKC